MQIRNQSFTLILHSFHSFVYAENAGCGPSVRLFANEGKIICNGNVLSCFGISTNYRGQDQIPTQIWKLSSEQGRDERTIQQINSCPVTKKKGNPSYYTLQNFHYFFKEERLQFLSSPKTREHC